MKLIDRLVDLFYSVERRSSSSQLTMDFGHFPPMPLQCSELKRDWDLVGVRGIGQVFQSLKIYRALVRVVVQADGRLDRETASQKDIQLVRNALEEFQQFPRLKNAVVWFTPIWLALRPCFSGCRGVYGSDGVGGYFNSLHPNEVVVNRATGLALSEAAIASHEHIHLLQHHDAEDHRRSVRSPSRLLSDKALAVPQLKYFFEKKEVEARLHECVLSFYRSRGHLPLTVLGFLNLLASSQRFGWLVSSILGLEDRKGDLTDGLYAEREEEFAKQFEMILLSMRTPQLERRFIEEVLTVMYGNLLRYYGDRAASIHFLEQVERFDLYIELYGAGP